MCLCDCGDDRLLLGATALLQQHIEHDPDVAHQVVLVHTVLGAVSHDFVEADGLDEQAALEAVHLLMVHPHFD